MKKSIEKDFYYSFLLELVLDMAFHHKTFSTTLALKGLKQGHGYTANLLQMTKSQSAGKESHVKQG